jgi:hypothetical protein
MKINIITRCTRLQNLKEIKDSIFEIKKPKNISIKWHVVFDTKVLKDIDADILNTLDDGNVQFHLLKTSLKKAKTHLQYIIKYYVIIIS